jgi:hypothetical protein
MISFIKQNDSISIIFIKILFPFFIITKLASFKSV